MIWLFLPLALAASALGLAVPEAFTWGKPYTNLFLGLIMFGMGLTLRREDFIAVWMNRRLVAVGAGAQYLLMPLLAYLISLALGLPLMATLGMMLVGTCPGGTASNVIAYLARANVALSVTLTLGSSLLAPLLTPALVELYVGETIAIPFWSMAGNLALIVLLPIVGGTVLRQYCQEKIQGFLKWFPYLSMLLIVYYIGLVMGLNRDNVLAFPVVIMLAVVLHNLCGLAAGYAAGWLFRANEQDRRTLAIEVGMQNSGLAAALGVEFFKPLAALPGALFSLWHNITGLILASIWRGRDEVSTTDDAEITND